MSAGMGGNTTTTVDWSDPNYWAGWNDAVGSLGSAVGTWVNVFDGQQSMQYQTPPPVQQNNTPIYIGFGLLFVLMIIILVVLFRKK